MFDSALSIVLFATYGLINVLGLVLSVISCIKPSSNMRLLLSIFLMGFSILSIPFATFTEEVVVRALSILSLYSAGVALAINSACYHTPNREVIRLLP